MSFTLVQLLYKDREKKKHTHKYKSTSFYHLITGRGKYVSHRFGIKYI